jgi:transcriptional regulator with XRE-family HTH domain
MWAGFTLDLMDDKEAARVAVREFLTTRRARVTPTDVGLPAQGTRRRVKGLRREEVALLAGVSPEYYVRLERGQATGPSAGVVDAVAEVLRLDEDERAHFDRLLAALAPAARRRRRGAAKDLVTPGIRVLLDSMDHLPAVVFNGRGDILAVNALGRALLAPVFAMPGRPNSARFLFLDEPRARDLLPQWDRIAADTVAMLRIEAGRHPDDPDLTELIGQLATRSTEFRMRWAANDVRSHRAGSKTYRHPLIGEVTLPYENLSVDGAPGQILSVYIPQPGTPAADAIRLLASWNADNQPNNNLTAGTRGQNPGAERPSGSATATHA